MMGTMSARNLSRTPARTPARTPFQRWNPTSTAGTPPPLALEPPTPLLVLEPPFQWSIGRGSSGVSRTFELTLN